MHNIVQIGVKMNCPYCNQLLTKGEILSQQGSMIYWQPENSVQGLNKLRFTQRGVKKYGGIILSKFQINIIEDCLIAYNCLECKKVIIDY